jgi:hypothetical protein
MLRSRLNVIGLTLLIVAVGGLSCSDSGSNPTQQDPPQNPPTTEVSFSQQVQPIFVNQQYGCVGCHGGSGGLLLTNASTSYANLVNVQAQTGCSDRKRVEPGSPNLSVLFLRLSGTTCGDRMPQGGNAISTAHLNLIRDWISQGAKNN